MNNRRLTKLCYLGLSLCLMLPPSALAVCDWPAWRAFKSTYISEQGRVIDPADGRNITTSEGQSYGLFFALVANDQEAFSTLLEWTENNLAQGDLTARLPAWLWGENEQQQWEVLDANSAADSDLWIAYNLLEAGRLWNNRRYQVLGTLLLQRIGREEVADIPKLGVMLLPGPVGFVQENRWTLNPSYLPPQLLARFASFRGPWQKLEKNYLTLLQGAAPSGLVPDWIVWDQETGWQPTSPQGSRGSYDAIRNYLWVGMLAKDAPQRASIVAHLQPMAEIVTKQQQVPEHINTLTGHSEGQGPLGFYAALLPFLHDTELTPLLRKQLAKAEFDNNAYYDTVLRLFGEGWSEGRYRFNSEGTLVIEHPLCKK